jgi:CRP-like cAMP-binding protein
LPTRRAKFEAAYRDRSLNRVLEGIELFRDLPQEEYEKIAEYVRARISFLRVTPGQVIFRQGEPANEAYLIRLGHIRVGVRRYGYELRVLTKGPGTIFGEIGLFGLSARDALKSVDQVDREIAPELKFPRAYAPRQFRR